MNIDIKQILARLPASSAPSAASKTHAKQAVPSKQAEYAQAPRHERSSRPDQQAPRQAYQDDDSLAGNFGNLRLNNSPKPYLHQSDKRIYQGKARPNQKFSNVIRT